MQDQPTAPRRLIRFPEVMERTSKSRASIYVDIDRGIFPKPVKLGPRSVAFFEDEIDAWLTNLAEFGRVTWADKHQAA